VGECLKRSLCINTEQRLNKTLPQAELQGRCDRFDAGFGDLRANLRTFEALSRRRLGDWGGFD
jgi:hypothetical protein